MPALPFDQAVAVRYGAVDIAEVRYGAALVWPVGQPRILTRITNTDRQLTLGIDVVNRVRDLVDIDWGDGTVSQGAVLLFGHIDATHTYATAGEKVITVKARGAVDHVDRYTLLTPHALVLTPAVAGMTVTLTVGLRSQVPIDIDWGDGSPVEHVPWANPQALTATMTHTYAGGGTYTITGADAGVTTTVTAAIAIPDARFPDSALANAWDMFLEDNGYPPMSGGSDPSLVPTIHIKPTQRIVWPGLTGAMLQNNNYAASAAKVWIAPNSSQNSPVGVNDGIDQLPDWQARYPAVWTPTRGLAPGTYWMCMGEWDYKAYSTTRVLQIIVDP